MKFNRPHRRSYLVIALLLCGLTKGVSQEGEKLGSWNDVMKKSVLL